MDPATALIAVGAMLLAAPLGIWLRGRIVDPPPPPEQPPLSEIRRHKLRDVSAIAYSVLTSRAGTLLQKALGGLVGPQVVKLFVELLVREELPVPADSVGPGQPDAEVIQRLRGDVVGDMNRIVGRLERDYPSSIPSIR